MSTYATSDFLSSIVTCKTFIWGTLGWENLGDCYSKNGQKNSVAERLKFLHQLHYTSFKTSLIIFIRDSIPCTILNLLNDSDFFRYFARVFYRAICLLGLLNKLLHSSFIFSFSIFYKRHLGKARSSGIGRKKLPKGEKQSNTHKSSRSSFLAKSIAQVKKNLI